MSAPRAVRAAVAALDGQILCLGCWSAIGLVLPDGDGPLVISHPMAGCDRVTRPDSIEARELAGDVLAELARLVLVGDYGEPEPEHRWLAEL